MNYEQFCKKIGGLIRIYRNKKGYSLNDFARELNVNYQQIQEYERGDHLPLFFNMLKIVRILEIPGNKIFDEATDKLDFLELSKQYVSYNKAFNALEESKELRDYIKYFVENKKSLEGVNLVRNLKTAAKKNNKKNDKLK